MGWTMNIKRGEVWLVDFNPTVGREQAGVRPALILSVNEFNNSMAGKVIAIPLSSKFKGIPLDVHLKPPDGGVVKDSYIKCEDIRSLSKDRLIKKWGNISQKILPEVEEKIKLLLGL
jgi:mRNA interferase MazF